MPRQLDINPGFQTAFDIIENTSRPLFITGKAGAGKSTLLDYCCRNSSKNLVVLAPTGVAALNVHGQTIHRFFSFPINVSVEKITSFQITPRAKRIYQRLQTLVIDEVSMLRADILDCIDAFLQIYGPEPQKPFGGVQMVFVGDLYQLPPVISAQEQSFFEKNYASPYFFSARAFRHLAPEVVELTKIYRQSDHDFIELLSRIRSNSITDADVTLLNSRLNATKAENRYENFCISLTTTNNLSDSINSRELEALEGRLHISQAVIDGNFSAEFYPAAEKLEFKAGAQVMFLNNDSKNRWVNGSVGHIEDIRLTEEDKVKYLRIRLHENQRLVDVFPYTWEVFKYTLQGKEIISEVVGSFTQYPLRLAWAVTIHKSQGKTFDNIEIDVGRGTFATGQLYVALSRCTSFEGISLKKPLRKEHIFTDWRITEFMNRCCPGTSLSDENKLQMLLRAIPQRQKLDITYLKADGKTSRRIIVPLHIRNGNLLAFCTQRQEQRTFTIDRIQTLSPVFED